eukprot:7740321-Pyramimonas_sp.AAC.1
MGPATTAPAQATTLVGSTGQSAGSDFDSGTGADTSPDDETNALDYTDMPTYLTEERQAQWLSLGHQKHNRRWMRFTKKPIRKARRTIRRALRGKSKCKRRRLHGRGRSAILAPFIRPQHEELFLSAGRARRRVAGRGAGRRGNPKDDD